MTLLGSWVFAKIVFFYQDASTFKILRYSLNFDPLSLFLEITRNTFAEKKP